MLGSKAKRELKTNQRRILIDSIEIGIPSPQQIKSWGERQLPNGQKVGQIKNSKTVNYKRFTPLRDGLFCERIFGPVNSFVCACGKRQPRADITFCEKCQVEYTDQRARRYRLGYIPLVSPVAHIWYLKGRPSYLSLFLGKRKKRIVQLAYCNAYLVEQAFPEMVQPNLALAPANVSAFTRQREAHGVDEYMKNLNSLPSSRQRSNLFYNLVKENTTFSGIEEQVSSTKNPVADLKTNKTMAMESESNVGSLPYAKPNGKSAILTRPAPSASPSPSVFHLLTEIYGHIEKNIVLTGSVQKHATAVSQPNSFFKNLKKQGSLINQGARELRGWPSKASSNRANLALLRRGLLAYGLGGQEPPHTSKPSLRKWLAPSPLELCKSSHRKQSKDSLLLQPLWGYTRLEQEGQDVRNLDNLSSLAKTSFQWKGSQTLSAGAGPKNRFYKKNENARSDVSGSDLIRISRLRSSKFSNTVLALLQILYVKQPILHENKLIKEDESFSMSLNALSMLSRYLRYAEERNRTFGKFVFYKFNLYFSPTIATFAVGYLTSNAFNSSPTNDCRFEGIKNTNLRVFPLLAKKKVTTLLGKTLRYKNIPITPDIKKKEQLEPSRMLLQQKIKFSTCSPFKFTKAVNWTNATRDLYVNRIKKVNTVDQEFNTWNQDNAHNGRNIDRRSRGSVGAQFSLNHAHNDNFIQKDHSFDSQLDSSTSMPNLQGIAQTPQKIFNLYNRSHTFPFLPDLICKYNVRDELLNFLNSAPSIEDTPIPLYCKLERWQPLRDVHQFMSEQVVSKFDERKPTRLLSQTGQRFFSDVDEDQDTVARAESALEMLLAPSQEAYPQKLVLPQKDSSLLTQLRVKTPFKRFFESKSNAIFSQKYGPIFNREGALAKLGCSKLSSNIAKQALLRLRLFGLAKKAHFASLPQERVPRLELARRKRGSTTAFQAAQQAFNAAAQKHFVSSLSQSILKSPFFVPLEKKNVDSKSKKINGFLIQSPLLSASNTQDPLEEEQSSDLTKSFSQVTIEANREYTIFEKLASLRHVLYTALLQKNLTFGVKELAVRINQISALFSAISRENLIQNSILSSRLNKLALESLIEKGPNKASSVLSMQAKSNVGSFSYAKPTRANSGPSKRSLLDDLACLPPKQYDSTFVTALSKQRRLARAERLDHTLESNGSELGIPTTSKVSQTNSERPKTGLILNSDLQGDRSLPQRKKDLDASASVTLLSRLHISSSKRSSLVPIFGKLFFKKSSPLQVAGQFTRLHEASSLIELSKSLQFQSPEKLYRFLLFDKTWVRSFVFDKQRFKMQKHSLLSRNNQQRSSTTRKNVVSIQSKLDSNQQVRLVSSLVHLFRQYTNKDRFHSYTLKAKNAWYSDEEKTRLKLGRREFAKEGAYLSLAKQSKLSKRNQPELSLLAPVLANSVPSLASKVLAKLAPLARNGVCLLAVPSFSNSYHLQPNSHIANNCAKRNIFAHEKRLLNRVYNLSFFLTNSDPLKQIFSIYKGMSLPTIVEKDQSLLQDAAFFTRALSFFLISPYSQKIKASHLSQVVAATSSPSSSPLWGRWLEQICSDVAKPALLRLAAIRNRSDRTFAKTSSDKQLGEKTNLPIPVPIEYANNTSIQIQLKNGNSNLLQIPQARLNTFYQHLQTDTDSPTQAFSPNLNKALAKLGSSKTSVMALETKSNVGSFSYAKPNGKYLVEGPANSIPSKRSQLDDFAGLPKSAMLAREANMASQLRRLDKAGFAKRPPVRNTRVPAPQSNSDLSPLELITIREILSYTGGGALQKLLQRFDTQLFRMFLLNDVQATRAIYKKRVAEAAFSPSRLEKRVLTRLSRRIYKNSRRLKITQLLTTCKRRPEWMMISILPVLPPDLRPILQMSESVVVASDLNNLYQRVIYRNNRFHKLSFIDFHLVTAIQRLVQDAVDRLIENGKGGSKPFYTPGGRPLKSLSDTLKGKKGRFRLNLLGKRVDFSGRSVIVVSPNLQIHECGLPREIALELYHYFLLRHFMLKKQASSIVMAKKIIKQRDSLLWDALQNIIYHHPVLLNRAPTLHRLGIQAFQPKLVRGSAILLNPLVCSGFNADFDGDQMGVHLPLSTQARAEAWDLLWSRNNLLSPATGQPVLVPSQDMVLGFYYMTQSFSSRSWDPLNTNKETGHSVSSIQRNTLHVKEKNIPTPKQIGRVEDRVHRKQTFTLASKGSLKALRAKFNVGSFSYAKPILANSGPSKRSQLDDLAYLPPKQYDKTFAKTALIASLTPYAKQETLSSTEMIVHKDLRLPAPRKLAPANRIFFNYLELIRAFQNKQIHLHTPVYLQWQGKIENDEGSQIPVELRINSFANSTYIYSKYKLRKDENTSQSTSYIRTTAGKVLVNSILFS